MTKTYTFDDIQRVLTEVEATGATSLFTKDMLDSLMGMTTDLIDEVYYDETEIMDVCAMREWFDISYHIRFANSDMYFPFGMHFTVHEIIKWNVSVTVKLFTDAHEIIGTADAILGDGSAFIRDDGDDHSEIKQKIVDKLTSYVPVRGWYEF